MAKKGRALAVAEFAVDRVITETLAVYREVLHNANARKKIEESRLNAKRVFDMALAALGLMAAAPVLGVIAAAIKLGSPGPVFYRGLRVGLHGLPFRIFKFRPMVIDAERLGGSATAGDDPRITRIGKFLRRYKLDELPQLLNVFKGDMSFVGPRPEVQKYVDMYNGEEKNILSLRPGITDWASIWNSNEGEVLEGSPDPEATYEELIRPTKIALQLKYFREHSLRTDIRIILHTLMKLIRPDWVPRDLTSYAPVERYQDRKIHQCL